MSLDCETPSFMFRPAVYGIRVVGRLGPEWSEFLEGMTMSFDSVEGIGVTTEIEAFLPDQAALMGVLQHFYDRLVPILRVTVRSG